MNQDDQIQIAGDAAADSSCRKSFKADSFFAGRIDVSALLLLEPDKQRIGGDVAQDEGRAENRRL